MTFTPGQRVTYYPPYRFSAPVAATVVRDDYRPGWVQIRKDNYPHPICVKRTSIKADEAAA